MATPQDLDKKLAMTDATVPDDAVEPDGGWIVYRRTWTDNNGVPQFEDNRMPVSEFAKWEKENVR